MLVGCGDALKKGVCVRRRRMENEDGDAVWTEGEHTEKGGWVNVVGRRGEELRVYLINEVWEKELVLGGVSATF